MLSLTALVLCSALITEDERPAPLRYNSTQFAHPAHRRTWPNWEPEALGAYGSVFDARQRKVVPARRAPPAFPAVWSARVAVERTVNGRLTSNETWHRWVDGDGSRLRADLLNSPNGTRTLLPMPSNANQRSVSSFGPRSTMTWCFSIEAQRCDGAMAS